MKHTFIYIVAAAALLCSCTEGLDIEQHGSLGSVEEFYKTDEEAEQAVAEVYYGLHNQHFDLFMIKNFLSDDCWCGGGARGDRPEFEKFNEYRFDANLSVLAEMYTLLYSTIYYANLILDNLEPDTAAKQRVWAEAKVVRALEHFELVTLFGTAPMVDHVLTSDEYHPTNSDPEDTWDFVEQDLRDAVDSGWLPSKTGVDDQATGIRITMEYAEALLGKTLLFREKYSEAATMLNKVVDSGLYALWTGDYDLLLKPETDNSCESVFELQNRDDAQYRSYMSNQMWVYLGWRDDKCTLSGQAMEELVYGSFGFGPPRESLYNAYMEMEGPDGYRFQSVIRTVPSLESYGFQLKSGSPLYGCEGYLFWKFRALVKNVSGHVSSNRQFNFTNSPMMRYAEVLLLAAEANLMAGDETKALDCLNQIRVRAREDELASCTLDDIKKEKRLELCMEAVRYQDLVRWGDAASVLADQGRQVPVYYAGTGTVFQYSNSEYGYLPKHKYLPIPAKELLVNWNMKQNEGW